MEEGLWSHDHKLPKLATLRSNCLVSPNTSELEGCCQGLRWTLQSSVPSSHASPPEHAQRWHLPSKALRFGGKQPLPPSVVTKSS